MRELIRTNDAVLISFVEALLKDAGIEPVVLDRHTSLMEGSLGVLPCRIMVDEAQESAAKAVLKDADIEVSTRG